MIERYAPAVEALNLPALSGAFYAQCGHRLWVQARFVEAIAACERAIALCAAAGDAVNAAHAALVGAEARAIREHAQNIGFPYVAAGALQVLAEIALLEGDPTQAAAMFRQAQAKHIAIDSRLRAAHARAGCGRALLALGERASAQMELAAAALTASPTAAHNAMARSNAAIASTKRACTHRRWPYCA